MNTETLTRLMSGFRGSRIRAGDAAYEEARKVWNGTIDRRPEVILRCRGADDVVGAVEYARGQGRPVTVRGGGHHVAGGALNEGGIVIDLSEMRAAQLDAASGMARADGGAQLRDVDAATLPEGRSVPMGVFSETGIGGLTLSGGYGWQSRLRGLSCDNLTAARVVTAEGRLLEADASENADLFWALRGGGTQLGVVTTFEYRTHPMPASLFLLFTTYPLEEGRRVLRGLRQYASTAAREVSVIAVLWTFQPSEAIPKELWNQPFVGILGTCIASAERGERELSPLRELARPLFDGSKVAPFSVIQSFFDDDYPKGRRYYWRSTYLKELDDDAIAALVDLGRRRPSALSSLDLWMLGGAIADVSAFDTPMAHRAAPYLVGIESNWLEPAEDGANVAWAREAQGLMARHSTGGSYLNFEDTSDLTRVAATYGANYQRLVDLKAKYDPGHLFATRARQGQQRET